MVESTYGDRKHERSDAREEIYRVMKRAADTNAAVIVPSFAIGRTQELLWHMHELKKEGRLPEMPIYVDSPMATAATLLYVRHDEDHDKEMRIDMEEGKSPFDPGMVRFVRDRSLSKQLNTMRGPMVIIAGSGMISGGRVVHHLKHRLGDPSTILLFTGYQARGTRGRAILEGAESVSIHGAEIEIRADIRKLNMLSAHDGTILHQICTQKPISTSKLSQTVQTRRTKGASDIARTMKSKHAGLYQLSSDLKHKLIKYS